MKIFIKKIYKLLNHEIDIVVYSLLLFFLVLISAILLSIKFDYVSTYCLLFIIINLFSIYFFSKYKGSISLLFALFIGLIYTISAINFLFHYDYIQSFYNGLSWPETETIVPYTSSHIFERSTLLSDLNYNQSKIHFVFLYLVTSYLAISLSIFYFEKKAQISFKKKSNIILKKEEYEIYKNITNIFILLVLIFLILLNREIINYNSITAISSAILRLDNIVILVVCFYIYFKDIMSKKNKFLFLILVLATFLIYILLTFSKSLVLLIILLFLFNTTLNNKKITLSVARGFYLFILVFLSFYIAIFLKSNSFVHLSLVTNISTIFEFIIGGIIARLSYFEFYIEKILNMEMYKEFINLNYYFKAVIDKLTPGFDLYNLPFASRQIYKVYFPNTNPNVLNSEQITLFAEAFMLFKYYSFLYYIIVSGIIIYALKYFSRKKNFLNFLICNYLLYIFATWILGIGLDQLFIKIELLILFIIFFILFKELIVKIKHFYK